MLKTLASVAKQITGNLIKPLGTLLTVGFPGTSQGCFRSSDLDSGMNHNFTTIDDDECYTQGREINFATIDI
jgi:hypothetical protein